MKAKEKRQKKMQVIGEKFESMKIHEFRKSWLGKGFELVDITQLCKFRLGNSGYCSDFNEPDENIYHIQVWYRDEEIGTLNIDKTQTNFEDDYVVFIDDRDFIIFKKCRRKK